jgi:hypothetical protein
MKAGTRNPSATLLQFNFLTAIGGTGETLPELLGWYFSNLNSSF